MAIHISDYIKVKISVSLNHRNKNSRANVDYIYMMRCDSLKYVKYQYPNMGDLHEHSKKF